MPATLAVEVEGTWKNDERDAVIGRLTVLGASLRDPAQILPGGEIWILRLKEELDDPEAAIRGALSRAHVQVVRVERLPSGRPGGFEASPQPEPAPSAAVLESLPVDALSQGGNPSPDAGSADLRRNEHLDPVGEIAASIMIAAVVTALAVTFQVRPDDMATIVRYPDIFRLALLLSVASLVLSIQSSLWMRATRMPGRAEGVLTHRQWAYGVAWGYNVGVMLALTGLALGLWPPGRVGGSRAIVLVISWLLVWTEIGWVLLSLRRPPFDRRRVITAVAGLVLQGWLVTVLAGPLRAANPQDGHLVVAALAVVAASTLGQGTLLRWSSGRERTPQLLLVIVIPAVALLAFSQDMLSTDGLVGTALAALLIAGLPDLAAAVPRRGGPKPTT